MICMQDRNESCHLRRRSTRFKSMPVDLTWTPLGSHREREEIGNNENKNYFKTLNSILYDTIKHIETQTKIKEECFKQKI